MVNCNSEIGTPSNKESGFIETIYYDKGFLFNRYIPRFLWIDSQASLFAINRWNNRRGSTQSTCNVSGTAKNQCQIWTYMLLSIKVWVCPICRPPFQSQQWSLHWTLQIYFPYLPSTQIQYLDWDNFKMVTSPWVMLNHECMWVLFWGVGKSRMVCRYFSQGNTSVRVTSNPANSMSSVGNMIFLWIECNPILSSSIQPIHIPPKTVFYVISP